MDLLASHAHLFARLTLGSGLCGDEAGSDHLGGILLDGCRTTRKYETNTAGQTRHDAHSQLFVPRPACGTDSVEILTPPLNPLVKCPFPRPPACTCALMTSSLAPSARRRLATVSASAGVAAVYPFCTRTLYLAMSALDWYSCRLRWRTWMRCIGRMACRELTREEAAAAAAGRVAARMKLRCCCAAASCVYDARMLLRASALRVDDRRRDMASLIEAESVLCGFRHGQRRLSVSIIVSIQRLKRGFRDGGDPAETPDQRHAMNSIQPATACIDYRELI